MYNYIPAAGAPQALSLSLVSEAKGQAIRCDVGKTPRREGVTWGAMERVFQKDFKAEYLFHPESSQTSGTLRLLLLLQINTIFYFYIIYAETSSA
jgi:hypothetical protein